MSNYRAVGRAISWVLAVRMIGADPDTHVVLPAQPIPPHLGRDKKRCYNISRLH